MPSTIHEIVGYREGLNPFTRAPQKYAVTRNAGRKLDLSSRA